MLTKLIISPSLEQIQKEIDLSLHPRGVNVNHPDVLYFEAGTKLGIGEARKIKEHFYLKPYSLKGKVVIIEDASVMTTEAQNALLKTLEEPPEEAILILGAPSDANLLPTILSRCEIHRFPTTDYRLPTTDIEKLINSSIEERFEYIEKLKDKKDFLRSLIYFFRELLHQKITKHDAAVQQNVTNSQVKDFSKELIVAEQWAKQNVNIRGILEYLMLKMPKT